MSSQHLPPQAPQAHAGASSDEQSAAATRLRGRWLVVARSAWVILFVLNLVWFGMALVSQISAVEHPCVDFLCTIKPAQAESLRRLGVGLSTFAVYFTGVTVLLALAHSIIAALPFSPRPHARLPP